MISDKEIKRIACQTEISYVVTNGDMTWEELAEFARAIYNLAQQRQRESDAALCRDAAENYLKRTRGADAETCKQNLAKNAAATMLENAILCSRNNKEK